MAPTRTTAAPLPTRPRPRRSRPGFPFRIGMKIMLPAPMLIGAARFPVRLPVSPIPSRNLCRPRARAGTRRTSDWPGCTRVCAVRAPGRAGAAVFRHPMVASRRLAAAQIGRDDDLATRHASDDFLAAAADRTVSDPGHLHADTGDRTAAGVLRPGSIPDHGDHSLECWNESKVAKISVGGR